MTYRVSRFTFAAVVTALGTMPALAQDRQVASLPPYEAKPSWTGFYVGAAFGGGALVDRVNTATGGTVLSADAGGQGILASVYGGYDLQVMPRALVGVLAEGTWSNIQSNALAQLPVAGTGSITTQSNLSWSALIRAGVLPTSSTLMYLIGGYTGQNFRTSGVANAPGSFATFTRDDYFNGWTIGTGLETKLSQGWSAKLEYRFTEFETKTLPGTALLVSPHEQAIRAGLSYKFGAGAAKVDDDDVSPAKVNWTGPYLGVAGGASAADTRTSAAFGSASSSIDGGGQNVLGSVYGGYDYQVTDRAVIGVMGDLAWSNPQSTQTMSVGTTSASVWVNPSMSWSVLGRAGFLPVPSTLLYAAAGYTAQSISTTMGATSASTGAAPNPANAVALQSNDTFNGWTVGPGIETVLFGGWSTRIEYRYSQYETRTLFGGGAVLQPSTHAVRIGLAYKFGVP